MKAQQAYFDPNAAQKRQHKLIRVIIILVVVGVVGAILLSIFSPDPSNSNLGNLLARQQEAVRVIDANSENVSSGVAANFINISRNVLVSANKELEQIGAKVSAPITNPGIDSQMEEAARNNRLDTELYEYIKSVFTQNQADIATALANASDKEKTVLQDISTSYQNLLEG